MIVKERHPELGTGTNDKEAEGSPEEATGGMDRGICSCYSVAVLGNSLQIRLVDWKHNSLSNSLVLNLEITVLVTLIRHL